MLDKMFGSSVKHGSLDSTPKRTYDYVLKKCMEELGELSVEVQIDAGLSYKKAGADGIQGEAVDLAIAAMDMFALTCGDMPKNEIKNLFNEIMSKKIDKWHKTSGVSSEKYTEVLPSGVHHSFNSTDKSYFDRISVWFTDMHPEAAEYGEDAGFFSESYSLSEYIGGYSTSNVYIHVADYKEALETYEKWDKDISANISTEDFTVISDAPYLFLVEQSNGKGVIFSSECPDFSLNLYSFSNGMKLSHVLVEQVARDPKLRSVKMWDDCFEDFYYNVGQYPLGECDHMVKNCHKGFEADTDDLYTICMTVNNLPHGELFEEGDMFVEIVERYEYCLQTKTGERGNYYEVNLECEVGNAYKQYNLEVVNGYSVLTSYGKIESQTLTSQKRKFSSSEEVYKFINQKTSEKLREGYSVVGCKTASKL